MLKAVWAYFFGEPVETEMDERGPGWRDVSDADELSI